jgi:hypothetical protein
MLKKFFTLVRGIFSPNSATVLMIKPISYRRYYWKEFRRHAKVLVRDIRGIILNKRIK